MAGDVRSLKRCRQGDEFGISNNTADSLGFTMLGVAKNPPGIVGRNLERLMKARGLRPTEVEKLTGVSRVTVWQLINGAVAEGSVQVAKKLADGLGVPLPEMFVEEERAVPIGPLVDEFLKSDLRTMLNPPMTAEEEAWLRGLSSVVMGGLPPATPAGIVHLVNLRRSSGQRDGGARDVTDSGQAPT